MIRNMDTKSPKKQQTENEKIKSNKEITLQKIYIKSNERGTKEEDNYIVKAVSFLC